MPRRKPLTAAEQAYADLMGREALERQQDEHRRRFPCCGQLRADGHALACHYYRRARV